MTKLEALIASMEAARPGTTRSEALAFIKQALPILDLDLWDGPADDKVVDQIIQEARKSRVADLGSFSARL